MSMVVWRVWECKDEGHMMRIGSMWWGKAGGSNSTNVRHRVRTEEVLVGERARFCYYTLLCCFFFCNLEI